MSHAAAKVPMMGFAAYSGTGKTTLLKQVLPILKANGMRVGVVKHAHHGFDIDYPGKDSYELRKSGAQQMLVGSRERWALIVETGADEEPNLAEMMQHLVPEDLDLILVEGYKPEDFPKIELHRPSLGQALLCASDPSIIAVASDAPLREPVDLPLLDMNSPASIASFILTHFQRSLEDNSL